MIIIIHGALGSAEQMKPLAEKLATMGEESICLELPGHGERSMEEPFGMDAFCKDVTHFLDSHNLEKVKIIGYSMGGYVALMLALNYPNRIDKIFTFSTKFQWSPETAAKEVRHLDAAKIKEKVPAFADLLAKRHGAEHWEKLLQKTANMMLDLGNNPPLSAENLAKITTACIIGTGDKDSTASPEESLWAYRNLVASQLWISPNTGHPFEKLPLQEIAQKAAHFFSQ